MVAIAVVVERITTVRCLGEGLLHVLGLKLVWMTGRVLRVLLLLVLLVLVLVLAAVGRDEHLMRMHGVGERCLVRIAGKIIGCTTGREGKETW